jgi:hypothetical protein
LSERLSLIRNILRSAQRVAKGWKEIDAASDLDRLRLVLSALSLVDEELMVQVLGFDVFRGEAAVPTKDAFSRFLRLLMKNEEELFAMFHRLVDALKIHLPDLGAKTAVDSKAVPSFGKPANDEEKLKERDGRRDTDADWGVKSYKGKRKDGTLWAPRDTRFETPQMDVGSSGRRFLLIRRPLRPRPQRKMTASAIGNAHIANSAKR